MPDFYCTLSDQGAQFDHFWRHVVGSGHVPLVLRAGWQAQLARSRAELGFERVRFHGLLHASSELIWERLDAHQGDDNLHSDLALLPQSVAAITIDYAPSV